ncbi:hypothetical protein LV716_05300 [Flagellimonas sp. HMM57]|uniref:hypothetical protein n=1 Tax=unclassified Flagellimonas TaxID=2644544 RepID=UPI0013D73816|nr:MULTISPECIES: hypothetical protein [unclassified Flagellimonas]UII77188.1 hypothetical protein LV716_05300 [Flagellimonas sp. HMM57]
MERRFDLNKMLLNGGIRNELDLEVALVYDRLLRPMIKENPQLKAIRKRLRDTIEDYETKNWSASSTITSEQIKESDLAELNVEKEIHEIKQSLIRFVQHDLS